MQSSSTVAWPVAVGPRLQSFFSEDVPVAGHISMPLISGPAPLSPDAEMLCVCVCVGIDGRGGACGFQWTDVSLISGWLSSYPCKLHSPFKVFLREAGPAPSAGKNPSLDFPSSSSLTPMSLSSPHPSVCFGFPAGL